jgi:hypothetical protein
MSETVAVPTRLWVALLFDQVANDEEENGERNRHDPVRGRFDDEDIRDEQNPSSANKRSAAAEDGRAPPFILPGGSDYPNGNKLEEGTSVLQKGKMEAVLARGVTDPTETLDALKAMTVFFYQRREMTKRNDTKTAETEVEAVALEVTVGVVVTVTVTVAMGVTMVVAMVVAAVFHQMKELWKMNVAEMEEAEAEAEEEEAAAAAAADYPRCAAKQERPKKQEPTTTTIERTSKRHEGNNEVEQSTVQPKEKLMDAGRAPQRVTSGEETSLDFERSYDLRRAVLQARGSSTTADKKALLAEDNLVSEDANALPRGPLVQVPPIHRERQVATDALVAFIAAAHVIGRLRPDPLSPAPTTEPRTPVPTFRLSHGSDELNPSTRLTPSETRPPLSTAPTSG